MERWAATVRGFPAAYYHAESRKQARYMAWRDVTRAGYTVGFGEITVTLAERSAEGQSQTGSERENDAEKEENDLQILPPLDSYEADVEVTEVRHGRAMPIDENDLGEKRPGG